jgi:hypothetical protein
MRKGEEVNVRSRIRSEWRSRTPVAAAAVAVALTAIFRVHVVAPNQSLVEGWDWGHQQH